MMTMMMIAFVLDVSNNIIVLLIKSCLLFERDSKFFIILNFFLPKILSRYIYHTHYTTILLVHYDLALIAASPYRGKTRFLHRLRMKN